MKKNWYERRCLATNLEMSIFIFHQPWNRHCLKSLKKNNQKLVLESGALKFCLRLPTLFRNRKNDGKLNPTFKVLPNTRRLNIFNSVT